ncbi:hypothetical protein [Eleftheria terrae]|uniref:hypothetical protein n=1 Tax=Eleftheria terrae TaxID=1597781 RepID=UPI00263B33B2|nr:hypothetical protein [Eleftheria terrae]WKB50819.1 hypothetical protein N7L95_13440 [Eleftheria terrae]
MDKKVHDPAPYVAMMRNGATSEEVYRQALKDGFKRFECVALLCGVFDLELDEARKIGHRVWSEDAEATTTDSKRPPPDRSLPAGAEQVLA